MGARTKIKQDVTEQATNATEQANAPSELQGHDAHADHNETKADDAPLYVGLLGIS